MIEDAASMDHITIRGRRLDLHAHVNQKLFDRDYLGDLRRSLLNAKPFEHLVVADWFNPDLLELVTEEFDMQGRSGWRVISSQQQLTHRSTKYDNLGPASDIYFNIVNSGWFVDLIGEITGQEDLLPDPRLFGGGMHETRSGGTFGIHRDFDRHTRTGLDNKAVLLTYLNKNWNPNWHAALELWNDDPPGCAVKVEPEFGTSVLMVHGPKSFHGHPQPMSAPEGQTRRSLATYYYANHLSVQQRVKRVNSVFLYAHKSKPLRRMVSRLMPPIVSDAIKKYISR